MGKEVSVFETLCNINVNEHTDDKNGLTYLSWAWAWAEFKKIYPNATYDIWRDENHRPYIKDDLGYMVFTSVTVGDLTHTMWLPVLDGANNTMLDHEYSFKTKWGKEVTVKAATMFDINTALMRCLTKNLAMFGLALYIYAGEDLPEDSEEKSKEATSEDKKQKGKAAEDKKQKDKAVEDKKASKAKASTNAEPTERKKLVDAITEHAHKHGLTPKDVADKYKINKSTPLDRLKEVLADIDKAVEQPKEEKEQPKAPEVNEEQQETMEDFNAIDEDVPWK